MPGAVVLHKDMIGYSRLGLTAMAQFICTEEKMKCATEELANMYGERVHSSAMIENGANGSGSPLFSTDPADFRRIIAPNPTIYTRLMAMPKKKFILAYKSYIYALHSAGIR